MINTMKFQYFSDIHTEEYKSNHKKLKKIQELIVPVAPNLIIAGDIGDPYSTLYRDFLSYLSPMYEHIFIVAGNHEYYGHGDMEEVQEEIRRFTESLGNVSFLENDLVNIPDTNLTIYGATFWSDIYETEKDDIKNCIGDYKYIPDFTIEKAKHLHKTTCDKLNLALNIFSNRNFVVISHHLPSYSLLHKKYMDVKPSLSSAYASNIPVAYNPRILAWVAGHSHTPCEQGKFHLNPFGYKGENLKYNFNKTFEVEIYVNKQV